MQKGSKALEKLTGDLLEQCGYQVALILGGLLNEGGPFSSNKLLFNKRVNEARDTSSVGTQS